MDWAAQAARHEEREQIYRQGLALSRQSQTAYEARERAKLNQSSSDMGSGFTETCHGLGCLGSLLDLAFTAVVLPPMILLFMGMVGFRHFTSSSPRVKAPTHQGRVLHGPRKAPPPHKNLKNFRNRVGFSSR